LYSECSVMAVGTPVASDLEGFELEPQHGGFT
jgi:hypothetical protein